MKHVVVVEHYARARGCYMYCTKPTSYLWWAKVKLWCILHFIENDCAWWIMTPERAKEVMRDYRNWMGVNRIGS